MPRSVMRRTRPPYADRARPQFALKLSMRSTAQTAANPDPDAIEHALRIVKRGCHELLVESEFLEKPADQSALGVKSDTLHPRLALPHDGDTDFEAEEFIEGESSLVIRRSPVEILNVSLRRREMGTYKALL